MTPRARALIGAASGRASGMETLRAVVGEPSGTVARILEADAVAPADLLADSSSEPERPFARCATPACGLLPAPSYCEHSSSFVSASPEASASVLADPAHLCRWALDPTASVEVRPDGAEVTLIHARNGRPTVTRWTVTTRPRDGGRVVEWIQTAASGRHDGERTSYNLFDIIAKPGGSELTRHHGVRAFGPLGPLVLPFTRRLNRLGAATILQNIAFVLADEVPDQPGPASTG